MRLQHAHPARRELDRERKAVETDADPGDCATVLRRDGEPWIDGPCAFREQPDRLGPAECLRIESPVGIGQSQGFDAVVVLTRQVQHRAARDHDAETWRCGQQVRDQRARREKVLEVIEHQQQRPRLQVGTEIIDDHPVALLSQTEAAGDRRGYECGIAERCKFHEEDAVGHRRSERARDADRDPRLARPAWTAEGHEPGSFKERCDLVDLATSTDEGRQLGRQRGRRLERT